jgi:hypothetical protein
VQIPIDANIQIQPDTVTRQRPNPVGDAGSAKQFSGKITPNNSAQRATIRQEKLYKKKAMFSIAINKREH